MKIIEFKHEDQGKAAGLGRAFGGINLPHGRQSQKAEELVLQVLQKKLDNRFICLRSFQSPELRAVPGFILIGPPGIFLFRISTVKGIYRAAGDAWEEFDSHSKKFISVKPNPVYETAQSSSELDLVLQRIGIPLPKHETLIYFSNPGAHVDTANPVVRILLADALERFIFGLLRMKPLLETESIDQVIEALSKIVSPQNQNFSVKKEQDIFSLREPEAKKTVKGTTLSKPVLNEPGFFKKLHFTSRQWLFISMMLIVNIVILVALVMVVLILT